MASYYIFDFVKDMNGCHFRLLPNNNRNQPIGISVSYLNIEECGRALSSFRKLIQQDKVDIDNNKNVGIELINGKGYVFRFYDNDGSVLFFRDRPYNKKIDCQNAIKNVIKNIDAVIM